MVPGQNYGAAFSFKTPTHRPVTGVEDRDSITGRFCVPVYVVFCLSFYLMPYQRNKNSYAVNKSIFYIKVIK